MERQDETRFTTKICGKTSLVLVISLSKIFIPSDKGMLCYVETGRSHPLIVRLYGYL